MKNKIAKSIDLDIPELKSDIGHCLFKLYYGNRYIISKAKNLAGTLFLFQKGYAYFLTYNYKASDSRTTPNFKIYNYIKKNPGLSLKVEVLLISDNCLELLKQEQIELTKSLKDKKCCNVNIYSYIPKYVEKTGLYNWISAEDVNSFYDWLINFPYPDNN